MSLFRRAGRPNWTKAEQVALAGNQDIERLVLVARRPPQPLWEALPQQCVNLSCLHHLYSHDLRRPLLPCVLNRCRCRSYTPARM